MKDLFGIFKYTLNNHKPKVPSMTQKLLLILYVHLRVISNLKRHISRCPILSIILFIICEKINRYKYQIYNSKVENNQI